MPARRRAMLLSGAVLGAVALAYAALFLDRHLDRSFVTYRYALNVTHGLGFAYNPGEPTLSRAVAPLYAFLLALGARFTENLPLLSNVIGAAAIGLGKAALSSYMYGKAYKHLSYFGEMETALAIKKALFKGMWDTLIYTYRSPNLAQNAVNAFTVGFGMEESVIVDQLSRSGIVAAKKMLAESAIESLPLGEGEDEE